MSLTHFSKEGKEGKKPAQTLVVSGTERSHEFWR